MCDADGLSVEDEQGRDERLDIHCTRSAVGENHSHTDHCYKLYEEKVGIRSTLRETRVTLQS